MNIILISIVIIQTALITFLYFLPLRETASITNLPSITPTPSRPLLAYTYENLRNYKPTDSKIAIDTLIKEDEEFSSYLFFFETKESKKVSGLINIPKEKGTYPVAILIRGFVDPTIYETGIGSQRVGEYLATNGFITLSPDFIGYGKSDKPSVDVFEDRFQTYTTVIDLLSSIPSLQNALTESGNLEINVQDDKIAIWGHSNGGQIALSVAEIMGHTYPTVVWAPVSKHFPYSILYYTDEFDDKGKALRSVLAKFEILYDVEKYSVANYFDWIKAPIQIHQGTSDEAIPTIWSQNLSDALSEKDVDVDYFVYPGENHNFQNGSWPIAISRTLDFFRSRLKLN